MLSLTAETHVEIDPAIADAEWLRKYAHNLTKREHVNLAFPENGTSGGRCLFRVGGEALIMIVFDVEQFKESQLRMLFTLADIDEL